MRVEFGRAPMSNSGSDLAIGGLVRMGRRKAPTRSAQEPESRWRCWPVLAYAELIAEGGEPLPLVLDDPLVFSDDRRLGALFEMMGDAAQTHQIVVLTCHERAFEPLVDRYGGTRLSIEVGAVN